MAYENNNTKEEDSRFSQKRITLEDNNPWLENKTPADLFYESELFANDYVEHHLKGVPDGQNSKTIERELEAFYSVKDPVLKRYTIRRIAGHPKTNSVTTDFKTNEYFISYNRDT